MNTPEEKAKKLAEVIEQAATELGLIFVDGPNTTPTATPQPDPNTTNGQDRMGFYFAVAQP